MNLSLMSTGGQIVPWLKWLLLMGKKEKLKQRLKKQMIKIQQKIQYFENLYGKLDRDKCYGQIDDMELIEWEGEIETVNLIQQKLTALENQQPNT